ncbi:MAG: hypothetical protein F4Z01_07920 [Gammaproteobacteria bacterium]|nr:hypothetical protein [Gammaproteobacteria bacterium]MYF38654.1 hypothetical protein [Gammaproteobacteria bacterium]
MIDLFFSVLCFSLGIVLAYASLAKVRTFQAFLDTVSELTNLSDFWVRMISFGVIGVELALGISFIFGFVPMVTFWVCLVVMLAMMGVSRFNVKTDTEALCLCFGQDGVRANSWKSISRSILILVATGAGLLMVHLQPDAQLIPMSFEIVALSMVVVLLSAWVTDIRVYSE